MSRTRWNTKSLSANTPGQAVISMDDQFRSVMARNAAEAMMSLISRRAFGGRAGFSTGNGRRNIEQCCGYIQELTFQDYYDIWDRVDIGKRVIEVYPDFTWMRNPEVYEDESESVTTKFEADWAAHVKANRPYAHLRNLDILAGIGRFGIMVMGVNDGKPLNLPLVPMTATATLHRRINYYRCFTEGEVQITQWDNDARSLRYGQPVMYKVTPNFGADSYFQNGGTPISSGGKPIKTADTSNDSRRAFEVHYTRVLHFADNAMSSPVYGIERLKPVVNRLTDIIKIVGGSAEMFWQGAFGGIAFEMDKDAEATDDDVQKMRLDIDNYVNQLQRTILLQGVKAKEMKPTIASPIDHLDVQLTLIAIASRIPKRVFAGSEAGKMASTQDSENWGNQVLTRSTNIADPHLLSPYTKFCIRNGIVRPPKAGENGFSTLWHPVSMLTKEEKAKAAETFTTALETYCIKGLYFAMEFADYLYYVMGYSSDEARFLARKFDKSAFEKIRKEALENKKTALNAEPSKTASAKSRSKGKMVEQ